MWILWQFQILIPFFSVYKIILIVLTPTQEHAKWIKALIEQMNLRISKA